MIGVGAQDDLSRAESFPVVYGSPPTMLWSDSSETWRHYGAGNDSVVLLDGAGEVVGKLNGFDPRRIAELLADLA